MKKIFHNTFIFLLLIFPLVCKADFFLQNSTYDICFTPKGNCASSIINEIKKANKIILVQAYNFTDISIAKALVDAKNKGLIISIILDKSQLNSRYSLINFFEKNKISVALDTEPAIAHNKIIIIDNHTVIGGSYNYSKAASFKNAENITIINDRNFAKKFINNWYYRKGKSIVIHEF